MDTVIRHVKDWRVMFVEFSRFARMPKPTFGFEVARDILRQAVFLIEVAKPDIAFSVKTPAEIEPLVCYRRLLSQAVTNIVKNAVEAIEEKYKNSDSIASGHVGAALEIGPGGEVVIREIGSASCRERVCKYV